MSLKVARELNHQAAPSPHSSPQRSIDASLLSSAHDGETEDEGSERVCDSWLFYVFYSLF